MPARHMPASANLRAFIPLLYRLRSAAAASPRRATSRSVVMTEPVDIAEMIRISERHAAHFREAA